MRTVSIILLLMTVLTCVGGLAVFSHEAMVKPVYADDDEPDDKSTLSFYSSASAFAQVAGYISSPDFSTQTDHHGTKDVEKKNIAKWDHVKYAARDIGKGVTDWSGPATPGTAGSMLGYYDAGDGNGFWGFFQTLASGTSTQYTYKALYSFPNVNGNKAFFEYAVYGYGLSLMGFDSTGGSSLGIVRILGGALFFMAFIVAFIVDAVFKAVLFVLNLLNPFGLFRNVSVFTSFSKIDADGQAFGSTLINMVSDLYDAIANLSLAVLIPVFVALFAFTLLVLRNTSKAKSQLKKIIIRLLVVAIGIPMLAGMYDACLQQLADVDTSATSAVQITGSTFFDFNAFVYGKDGMGTSPLKLANALMFSYAEKTNTIDMSSSTYLYLQNYCWDQNVADGAVPYISSPAYTMGSNKAAVGHTGSSTGRFSTASAGTTKGFNECVSLLTRYMFSDKIAAGEYESQIKSGYLSKGSNETFARVFAGLRRVRYGKYDSSKSYEENKNFGLFSYAQGDENKSPGSGDWTIFRTFILCVTDRDFVPEGMEHFANGTLSAILTTSKTDYTITFRKDGYLSHLATYNYLNTYFESKSLSCYSPSNAASLFVMRQHYQVNLIGTGMIAFMYWLNGCVMLWCIAIMGLMYGIGILIGNLKRGIKLLMQVPFAALGAMKSIARVISWTVMMMIEIMVTLFLYSFISQLFMQIPAIIASPIMNVLEGNKPDGTVSVITLPGVPMAGLGGYMLAIAVLVVSVIVEVVFTIMAIKLRKQIVKAVDEEAARIVEQVIGVGPGAASELPSQPGPMHNMASNALAAGAMAHALDSGSGGGAAFEKSASADSMGAQRAAVGTGDGSEEQAQADAEGADGADANAEGLGMDTEAGDTTGQGGLVGTGAGGNSSMNIENTEGDVASQQAAQEVIRAGGLGAAAGQKNITQNDESNDSTDSHTENGGDTITNEGDTTSTSASGPVDLNDADVERIGAGEDAAPAASGESGDGERGTYSNPVNLDNADVERIANSHDSEGTAPAAPAATTAAVKAETPAGRPGEGGKGGDGKKGEDGQDAPESTGDKKPEGVRAVQPQPSYVPGLHKDDKGKLVHEDGTAATKSERKQWRDAEKAAERDARQAQRDDARKVKAAREQADAERTHEDGTHYTKAENRALHQREVAEAKADEKIQAARSNERNQQHAVKAQDAQKRADAERAMAQGDGKMETKVRGARTGAEAAIDARQSGYEQRKRNTRSQADEKRSAARADADSTRQAARDTADQSRRQARATVVAEKERAFEARMKSRFPQAVDAEGKFHPEALTGRAKAQMVVLQKSHDIAMGTSRVAQNAGDSVRGAGRATFDAGKNAVRATRDTAQGAARAVEDASVKTATSVGKKVVHTSLGAVENTAGAAHTAVHTHAANSAQKDALKEARRSRMYVPGVNYEAAQRSSSSQTVERSGSSSASVEKGGKSTVKQARATGGTTQQDSGVTMNGVSSTQQSQRNLPRGARSSGPVVANTDATERSSDTAVPQQARVRPAAIRSSGNAGGADATAQQTPRSNAASSQRVDVRQTTVHRTDVVDNVEEKASSQVKRRSARSVGAEVIDNSGAGKFKGGRQTTERVERVYVERGNTSGSAGGGGHFSNGGGTTERVYVERGSGSNGGGGRSGNGGGAGVVKNRTIPTYSGGNRQVDRKQPTPKQQAMKQFAAAAILSRMGNTGAAIASGLQTAAMMNMMGGMNSGNGGMSGRQAAATVMAMRMANQQAQQSNERRRADERRVEDAVQRVLNQTPDGQ